MPCRRQLAGLFDAETFSSDCGLVKPEPEIYLTTLHALGVEPADALFVGDGANDELGGAERVGIIQGAAQVHEQLRCILGIIESEGVRCAQRRRNVVPIQPRGSNRKAR